MKKYSNLIIVLISFITLIFIIMNKALISSTIITSFYIWFNTLVPSMFPMLILSDILIKYHFSNYIPKKIINFISKLFNISKEGVLIFFLSLISGFPANAINIKTALDMHLISKEEAEHLLLFCNFANPLFVLETVGNFYFKSNLFGVIILFSHILANIFIAIFFRNKKYFSEINYIPDNSKCQSFGNILPTSIRKAIDTLLMIGGTVTLFLVLSTLITTVFHLNDYLSLFIKALLEMTMAVSYLSNLNINNALKVAIATAVISFSGLSIHLQVISSLDEDIRYKNYLIGRILQALLSFLIALTIILLI